MNQERERRKYESNSIDLLLLMKKPNLSESSVEDLLIFLSLLIPLLRSKRPLLIFSSFRFRLILIFGVFQKSLMSPKNAILCSLGPKIGLIHVLAVDSI